MHTRWQKSARYGLDLFEFEPGYGIAKRLAEAGASVIVNGRTREDVDEAIERLRAEVPAADVPALPRICPTPRTSAG